MPDPSRTRLEGKIPTGCPPPAPSCAVLSSSTFWSAFSRSALAGAPSQPLGEIILKKKKEEKMGFLENPKSR